MKITKQILSIPPYLSVAWEDVSAVRLDQTQGEALVVTLKDGTPVIVPHLNHSQVAEVFTAHQQFLEQQEREMSNPFPFPGGGGEMMGFPLRLGPGGIEGLGSAMEHDPDQADAPDLPPEVLQKIGSISQMLGIENVAAMPRPESGCNCFHCQIARAMQGTEGEEAIDLEEEVSDEELKFRNWDIEETGDKLYNVTNPLDPEEKYSVYLGEPVGCTCGQANCEHIKSVLQS